MSIATAFDISAVLGSIGLAIASIHYAFLWRELADGRLFGWDVIQTHYFRNINSPLAIALRVLMNRGIFVALMLFRALALCVFVVLKESDAAPWLLLFIVASMLISSFRFAYGQDGSDQMYFILMATLFARWLTKGIPGCDIVCASFLTMQLILSYVVAGIAKAISREWRNGSAIYGILNTRDYGNRYLSELLTGRRVVQAALAWSVITVECASPMILLGYPPLVFAFLIWGIAFHAFNAIVMKLDHFLWSFVAGYPVVAAFCLR